MPEYRVQEIPVDRIVFPPQERKRFDPATMAALTETIKVHGVEQAFGVVANGDRFDGIWGERRWLACKAAGLATIPAVIREAPRSEAEAIELRLVENVARESLNPIELAEGLARLMKTGALTATQVAARVGMSNPHVSKTLQLLRLPEAIREQIRCGKISAGAGYALSQVEDPAELAELATQVVSGTLGRDGVSGALKRGKRNQSSPAPANPTRISAVLGCGRTIVMSGSGLTSLDVMIQWLEELLARARKVRPQGIELKTFTKMLKDQANQAKAESETDTSNQQGSP